jgi:hypothetical protein
MYKIALAHPDPARLVFSFIGHTLLAWLSLSLHVARNRVFIGALFAPVRKIAAFVASIRSSVPGAVGGKLSNPNLWQPEPTAASAIF